ncbi:McrC family protein [Helicobacter sp.]|uniref:McrC family protein n=1 Tax=Helicobacter sp. TaxID=218 RepID=UPI00388F5601
MKKLPTLSIREWDYIDWQKIAKALAEQSAQNLDSTSKAKLEQKAKQIFSDLCDFAMQERARDLLGFKDSNTLKARQYVGIISTKSGFCVEILPKLADLDSKANTDEQQGSIKQAREVFLKMLKTLRDSPFKHLELSAQDIARYPLLEAFVLMFVREVKLLLQRGLRCDYISIESNRNVLKGRLLFNEHLRQNFIHKERFFTASDEFSANIAPNRLLKTTLLFLANQGFSPRIQSQILALLLYFDEIDEAQNIEADFSACPNSRHFKAYENLLAWCKVFLKHLSFCPSGTKTRADSLLFDMNVLFESFVAWHLKEAVESNEINVRMQVREQLTHSAQFAIRPDIVLDFANDKQAVIADTKYKRIDCMSDIQHADLYQVLAYLNAFDCKNALLIYPQLESNNQQPLQKPGLAFKSFGLPQDASPKAHICVFNLLTPETSAKDLLAIARAL